MSIALTNGSGSHNESPPTETPRYPDASPQPIAAKSGPALVDGASVEIPQHLITQVEAGCEQLLPTLEPDDSILGPVAEAIGDEATSEQVRSTLSAHPIIAGLVLVRGVLKDACTSRRDEVTRVHRRLLDRQSNLKTEVPVSQAAGRQRSWMREVAVFWCNWSGLGFASLAACVGATVFTEIAYQIGGLRESSWGLVQSFFGAFGFCWGFTVAVVVATNWRRRVMANSEAHPLDRRMSAFAFSLAWWGLAGFGLLMGLMHSFEEGDGRLLPLLKCTLTTASVLSLGMLCVAIEKGAEWAFKSAYQWTLVANPEIEALDEELHPVATQLMQLAQIERLADSLHERIEHHIRSQQQRWLSRRDELCGDRQREREIAAEEAKVLLSQQRLAGLKIADAS